jgi:RNA polymerase sigma factor (sigma-70 family)
MAPDDTALVRQYAASRSEAAFTTLVQRHIHQVHSAAMRQANNAHLAEEITQAVFIILARKAKALGPNTILSAWLYRTTHFAAKDALRAERRRHVREQEAYMQSTIDKSQENIWTQLAPLLDMGMNQLGETNGPYWCLNFFKTNRRAKSPMHCE